MPADTRPRKDAMPNANADPFHAHDTLATPLGARRVVRLDALRDAGFGHIEQLMSPPWAPEGYRKGDRLVLFAHRAAGPDLNEDAF